jgi:hypothetical protein
MEFAQVLHLINISENKLTSVRLRFGEIQLVARDDGLLIDLQSRGYDSLGQAYRQHAHSKISVEEVLALRDALTCILSTGFHNQVTS